MTTKRSLNRHTAREKVLQALYAIEISKEKPENVFNYIFENEERESDDFRFAQKLFNLTIENSDLYLKTISEKLQNWDINRIAILDKIILKMSLCELNEFKDIPPKVTFNEAITLAKYFSTDESSKFVNGVLNAIFKELEENKSIKKTGRGLLSTSKK